MSHRKFEVIFDEVAGKWKITCDGVVKWYCEEEFTAQILKVYLKYLQKSLDAESMPMWYDVVKIFSKQTENFTKPEMEEIKKSLLRKLPILLTSIISEEKLKQQQQTKQSQQKK